MKFFKRLFMSSTDGTPDLKQQPVADEKSADRFPDIRMVITDCYRGAINDVIYMIIRNVDHVMVGILSAEGKEVEKGPAMNSSGVWSYRTGVANPGFSGGRVVVRAGNIRGDQIEVRVAVV
ncbi:hypothetical protein [Chitinophaga filiformis]|uniref:Gliding motility-associated C-terminal domain-containing protein n=1 Tax=Chitinophaga filiformis TaxID=104663 RepID=A0A1G7SII9_CHIFI|nr:hypothetical protein [Chitinophaga filiformis]SDG22704.1 hypothetical protein SAMN04488121_103882 [Chitinophaga filiformis]